MNYEEFKKKHQGEIKHYKGHKEDDIQIACVGWFRTHYPEIAPLLFHPNNEAYLGGFSITKEQREIKGKRAKDKGVTAGVADLILLVPNETHHALCVELKTLKGRQDGVQKEWQSFVQEQGYRYEIVRSLEEFQTLVQNYTGKPPMNHEEAVLAQMFGRQVKIHRKQTKTP